MQNQSKTTVFIFFSESQAIAFSEAARTLLTWPALTTPQPVSSSLANTSRALNLRITKFHWMTRTICSRYSVHAV